jgi:integrase
MSKIDGLLVKITIDVKQLPQYDKWLIRKTASDNTRRVYIQTLKLIAKQPNLKDYLTDENTEGKIQKIFAYRSWLKFCREELDLINRVELEDLKELFEIPKRRGTNAEHKTAYPMSEWQTIMGKGVNKNARMGMWIGFNFGLRLGEIVNLEVSDIDFNKQEILIRAKSNWSPKYNRSRQLHFNNQHAEVFKSWIDYRNSQGLTHDYLLFTVRNKQQITRRNFQRYMQKAGISAHELRYSFATHFYQKTKDLALISDLLGHANLVTTSGYLRIGKENIRNKARSMYD